MSAPFSQSSLAAIAARLAEPRAWEWRGAVIDWLAAGYCMVYGPSGTGKTFTLIDWSLRVAAGLPIGPYRTRQGAVIYVAAEDKAGVEQRIVAAAEAANIGFNAPVFVVTCPGPSHDDRFPDLIVEQAVAAAGGKAIAMVVIDTLGATTCESLNEDRIAARVTNNLNEIGAQLGGASVVAIHHTGKDEDRGARGAQILFDRAETFIRLSRIEAGSRALVEKQRNGQTGACLDITFGAHRVSFAPLDRGSTLVVIDQRAGEAEDDAAAAGAERGRPERKERPLTRRSTKALEALHRIGGNAGWVNVEDWRAEAIKSLAGGTRDNGRKAWHDAKAQLFGRGLVVENRDCVTVSERYTPVTSNDRNGALPGVTSVTATPLKGGGRVTPGNGIPELTPDEASEGSETIPSRISPDEGKSRPRGHAARRADRLRRRSEPSRTEAAR